MKKILGFILIIGLITGLATLTEGAEKGVDIKSMSVKDQIKLAESAAPPHISKDATIMVKGADGKMVEGRKGTNGYTCFPDIDGQEIPDPICGDAAAMKWINDLMGNAPKPTNAVPGIAYMAKGGWHWEKDGKIIMNSGDPAAKRVAEPPHWMVFWPFDSKTSGLPTMASGFGTYIMFDGSPYAHLMIYQDPNRLK